MSTIGTKIILEGEKEYRNAITDINRNMRVLRSEMRATTAEFDGNANSVEALSKKNEILSKQQAEQEEKVKLLRGALENATKEFGENSKQVQNWQIQLNNAQAQVSKLSNELNANEKYLEEAKNSTNQTATSINEFGREVKDAGEETLKTGDIIKANLASEAIVEGVKALGKAMRDVSKAAIGIVKDTAAYADEMLTLSETTGIALDTLQELNYMQELTDVSMDTMVRTMSRQIRGLETARKGTGEVAESYKKLNVELVDMQGNFRDSNDIFWESIDALGMVANETERDVIAMQIFGRSARELAPLMNIGSAGVAKFAQEARDMGAVLSEETMISLGETDDALQRLYEQIDIAKREFGIGLAPAMTEAFEKITAKIGEADEELAEFASGTLESIVNGFIWVIDNADKVEAGLKGVGTAIITKKAATGILSAAFAYNQLKKSTEATTTAQIAFNTATKANIIGALAGAIIGISTSMISYSKNAREAAEETRRLNDEALQLIESSEKTSEAVQNNIDRREESIEKVIAEANSVKSLVDSLYELEKEESKSNVTKEKMLSLIEQINKEMPALNLALDEQALKVNKSAKEVERLLQAEIELSTVKALQGQLTDIALDRYNQEQALNDLLEAQILKEKELKDLQDEINRNAGYNAWETSEGKIRWLVDAKKDIKRVNEELDLNRTKIDEAKEKVEELTMQYRNALDYIGDHSVITTASNAIEEFGEKLSKTLKEQENIEIGSLEDRQKNIRKIYEETGKELDKQLRAEEREFRKSQQRRVEEVQKAQQAELKEIEKAHKTKIDLINKEYLEKIKTVDEDRYKELKRIQDELDAIDAQQEAEDRALEAREEAEKKAELQLRVEQAKTVEERMDAQKELQRYEERVARNRLKEERTLQKNILNEQKDTINKSYDEKIKSIEAEQKAEQDKLNEQFAREKEALEERYKLKLEALKDEQELERDALKGRQTEYKNFLREQRELAIANSKEIYEADLAEFKMAQALKYEEVMSSEEQMKRAIQEYAYKNMQPGPTRDKVLRSNDLNEMLQHYNPSSALQSSAPQTASIDYGLVEDAMSRALRNLNLSIKLDKRTLGQVIDERINYNLRR